jgi:methyl-accepting chemotaxis protein
MESVADIKNLTADIQQTTAATVEAINEGRRLAASTTDSARLISLAAEQQRRGTELVFQAMNDIAKIAKQTVDGSKQSTMAIEGLTQLAEKLQERVEGFKL